MKLTEALSKLRQDNGHVPFPSGVVVTPVRYWVLFGLAVLVVLVWL